jgi:hypothetical protein
MARVALPFSGVLTPATAPSHDDVALLAGVGVWLCGFAAVALMRLQGWRRIRAAVRSSTPLTIPGASGAAVDLRQIPTDPFTNRSDSWQTVAPKSGEVKGVYDVRSGSDATALDGTKYSRW